MKVIVRITQGLFLILFGYATLVQLNDPDPVLWSALYSVAVCFSAAAFLGYSSGKKTLWILSGVYGLLLPLWSALHWPLNIEEQREVGGLFLLLGWAVFTIITGKQEAPIQVDLPRG